MYVEERLATLENITNQHGKQIEMVAEGLAALTNRVERGFTEMREGFEKVDQRFEQVDQRFDRLEARVDRIEVKLDEHDARFDRIDQQFLQVHGVLAEIVTLVKSKL